MRSTAWAVAQPITDSVSSRATGGYRFHGIVKSLRPDGRPVEPLANVFVNVGERSFFTGADGRFEISDLPDTGQVVLEAAEQSGAQFFEIATSPLDPVDREFELLMLQYGVLEFDVSTPQNTERVSMSRLEFFRYMTGTREARGQTEYPLFTWAEYPIDLYVHPLTIQSEIELVDYEAAMVTSAEAWNEAAGEELIRIRRIDSPYDIDEIPEPGVIYLANDPDIAPPTLGTTTLRSPPGDIFEIEESPRAMSVGFREGLRTNSLARLVAVHELGHVLGLRHDSPADLGTHVMTAAITSASQGEPQPEEAFAARFLALAAGKVEMQWYREPSGLGDEE